MFDTVCRRLVSYGRLDKHSRGQSVDIDRSVGDLYHLGSWKSASENQLCLLPYTLPFSCKARSACARSLIWERTSLITPFARSTTGHLNVVGVVSENKRRVPGVLIDFEGR